MEVKHLKQTNRTILFSKVNSEMPSLVKIFSEIEDEEAKAISEELLKKIEDNLVVDSFEQYLERFKPTIYSESVNGEIRYALRKDGPGNWVESPINMSNDFIRLILNIIEGKAGITNIEFEYQDEFKKLLGAEAASKKIDEAVDTIKYLLSNYEKAEEGSPEQRDAKKAVMREYQKYVKNYNNPISILPWYQNMIVEAITDKEKILDYESRVESQIEQKVESQLIMKKNGIPDLTPVERDNCDESVAKGEAEAELNDDEEADDGDGESHENSTYRNMLMEVYDKGVDKGLVVSDNTGREMLAVVFGRKDSVKRIKNELRAMSGEELTDRYNKFAKQIDSQYKNFAKIAKQLIEEIIGVRMFFEQSKIKRNRMSPKLLVTNCELDELIGKENQLEQFLERTNRTESDYDSAIWYAIIPNMKLEEKGEDDDEDWFDDETEEDSRDSNTVSSVTKIVRLLGEYNIQSFVGFENNKDNTFANIQQKGIQKYKDATERFVDNEEINKFMIPCIPNFTIVPENKSRIRSQGEYSYIAAEAVNDEEKIEYTSDGYIELGGFYVNAAYIAAGIVCACQSPDYLREKKLNVVSEKNIPGVRFDIENHFDKIDVKMGVEVGGYTEKVKNEINDEQFGFVFTSEGGDKARVMKARCLKKTEDVFEPIFVTSTYTYIERLYKSNNINNITKDTMESFFGDNMKSIFWKKYRECDNGLLQKDDELHHEIIGQDVRLDLTLRGVKKQLNFSINH